MKKYLLLSFIIGLITISGCITQQEIPPSNKVSDDNEKVTRFDFMERRWNTLINRWVTAEKVTPYVLMTTYNIPKEQAAEEVNQFIKIQDNNNWFQRFFTWINLCGVRYYINPPE